MGFEICNICDQSFSLTPAPRTDQSSRLSVLTRVSMLFTPRKHHTRPTFAFIHYFIILILLQLGLVLMLCNSYFKYLLCKYVESTYNPL